MAKDPAFLFYPGDWLGGTMALTLEQKGAYIELLVMQWHCQRISQEDAIRLVKEENWYRLKSKFIQDEAGFFNQRLEEERQKRKKHSENQSFNAKKRWQNQETESMPLHKNGISIGITDAMPLEDENENENRLKGKGAGKPIKDFFVVPAPTFEDAWIKWKKYKKDEFRYQFKSVETERIAFEKLFKLAGGNSEKAAAIVKQSIENGWKGLFNHNQNQKNEITSRNNQRPEPSENIGSLGFGKL